MRFLHSLNLSVTQHFYKIYKPTFYSFTLESPNCDTHLNKLIVEHSERNELRKQLSVLNDQQRHKTWTVLLENSLYRSVSSRNGATSSYLSSDKFRRINSSAGFLTVTNATESRHLITRNYEWQLSIDVSSEPGRRWASFKSRRVRFTPREPRLTRLAV